MPHTRPRQFDLIAFDWDGTLYDSTAIIVRSIQEAVRDVGGTVPSDKEAAYVIGMALMPALAHAAPDVPPEKYTELGNRYRFHYLQHQDDLSLFDGVLPMLASLRECGHLLAVATGTYGTATLDIATATITYLLDDALAATDALAEGLGHVAHRAGSVVGAGHRGERGALAAVTAEHVLDDFLAALVLEIDVDIRRLVALAREKALEQQAAARIVRVQFGDAEGKPVGLKFWRYAKLLEDTRIPADGWRDEAWPLPADAQRPFKADIRLNFRTYPKWVNDAVRAAEPSLPEPPIVLLNRLQLTLQPFPITPDTEPQS